MANYIIVSDTTCDLPVELVLTLGVKFLPLSFTVDGTTYKGYLDEREYKLSNFYNQMRDGKTPTTSQVNIYDAEQYFKKYLSQGLDILCITFSSALSGTHNSFRIAAENMKTEFPERTIEIVDSLCACSGEGILVYQAAKNRREGMSLRDNKSYCEHFKHYVRHWFTVDDLDTLVRGGRLTASKAMIAKALKIKPILNVSEEGKLQAVTNKLGRKSAIKELIAESLQGIELEYEFPTFVSHADCPEDAEYAKKILEEEYKKLGIKSKIYIAKIGPVIGAHAGPGTIAIFTVGDKR